MRAQQLVKVVLAGGPKVIKDPAQGYFSKFKSAEILGFPPPPSSPIIKSLSVCFISCLSFAVSLSLSSLSSIVRFFFLKMSEGSEETKTKLDSAGELSDVDNENCSSSGSGGGSCGDTKRTCVDCGTIRTPLWRGGPAGPKVRF